MADMLYVAMTGLFLALIVIVFLVGFLFTGEVQATSFVTEPLVLGECEKTQDCITMGGGVCMSINGGETFCGCLIDNDCGSFNCVDNRCS